MNIGAVSVLTLAALLPMVSTASALAADAPRLTVQWSNDGSLLVVGDSESRALAFYKVEGKTVSLIASRDLAKDMAGEAAKIVPNKATLPADDVPGEDPPGFRRPPGAVRTAASCDLDNGEKEAWRAAYIAPGSVDGVFAKLRPMFSDWRLHRAGVNADPYTPRADFNVSRDDLELAIGVFRNASLPEGWVQLQVDGTRRKRS